MEIGGGQYGIGFFYREGECVKQRADTLFKLIFAVDPAGSIGKVRPGR